MSVLHEIVCPACHTNSGTRWADAGFRPVVIRTLAKKLPGPCIFECRPCRSKRCGKWLMIEVVWVGVGNELSSDNRVENAA